MLRDTALDGPLELDARGHSRSGSLRLLLDDHPFAGGETLVHHGDEAFSLGEIRDRVGRLAGLLRAAGVGQGQPVIGVMHSSVEMLIAMFAVWEVGGVHVPLNARLTPPELHRALAETPVTMAMGDEGPLEALGPYVGTLRHAGQGQWESGRAVRQESNRYDDDVALVLRTSGTTGDPKAVMLSHAGILDGIDSVVRDIRGGPPQAGERAKTPNLIPVSLSMWAGIYNSLFGLRVGAALVLMPSFSSRTFAGLVARHRIRSTVLAPPMMAMILSDETITSLSPLRFVRSITAPLAPDKVQEFMDRFSVSVLNSYGQTELGGEVIGWTARDLRSFGRAKLGALGRPHPGVEVRILADDGTQPPDGELGEIAIKSESTMAGYVDGDGGASRRVVDGFLRTGDLGHVDEDGFVWITGRVSDMINRGGLKVAPQEVEEVLAAFPAVEEACVVGLPDARLGEVPHAWYTASRAIDPAELSAWVRASLAPYKVPVDFHRVDQLPKSDLGKVLRRSLADQEQESA